MVPRKGYLRRLHGPLRQPATACFMTTVPQPLRMAATDANLTTPQTQRQPVPGNTATVEVGDAALDLD